MRLLVTSYVLAATLALPILFAGCPNDPPNPPTDGGADGDAPGCKLDYIGDEAAPIVLELTALDPAYVAHPFEDGDDASILFPPQGGRVIFIGVRAKNLDPCGVKLNGAVRDLETDQVRADIRTVNLDATQDGWGVSDAGDISTFSNIPVCPNSWASTDIFDQTFGLEVKVTDRGGKEAVAMVEVVPRCDETKIFEGQDLQKECLCMCKDGYVTGEMCQ